MAIVGRVESVWRYPVKSMQGEELHEAFVGFGGVRGDRIYAIHDGKGRKDFPYFTAREQGKMLLCRPMHREGSETDLEIETPDRNRLEITDPYLLEFLAAGMPDRFQLTVLRSDRALTDCSPVSLISTQTVQQLTKELGSRVDKRCFRANIYLDLGRLGGFAEDQFVGHRVQIGSDVILAVIERDVRCKMITLDPDTSVPNPEIMKLVARSHESQVGIYANVLAEGVIRPGDAIKVLDSPSGCP